MDHSPIKIELPRIFVQIPTTTSPAPTDHNFPSFFLTCGNQATMSVDRIILESLGVLLVGGGAFLLSNVFALAPLAPDLSKKQSNFYFVAIPVAVYAAFRLYFGALFYATKTLSVSRPRIGEGPKHHQGPVCP